MTLALGMIVRNEAPMLRLTLPVHAEHFEIKLALDTGSPDNTVDVLKEHGFTVMHAQWRDDFSYARNIVLDVAETLRINWVLMLDADETMWPKDIDSTLLPSTVNVVRFPRINLASGGQIQEIGSYPDLQARCIRPSSGVRFRLPVHEVIDDSGSEHAGHIYHYGWTKSVSDNWLRSMKYEIIAAGGVVPPPPRTDYPTYDEWIEEMKTRHSFKEFTEDHPLKGKL